MGDDPRDTRTGSAIPEIRLALTAVRACVVLAPIVAASAFLLGGRSAALGGGTGVTIVGLLAAASLPLYGWAAKRGTHGVAGAAFGGVILRLTLAATAFAIASRIPALSMTSLAIALALALCVTIVAEMRVAGRDPRLYRIDLTVRDRAGRARGGSTAVPVAPAGTFDSVSERTTA